MSLNTGELAVVECKEQEYTAMRQWKAHEYEAWTVCSDIYQPDILYSGGDDCRLRSWDLRCSTDSPVAEAKR